MNIKKNFKLLIIVYIISVGHHTAFSESGNLLNDDTIILNSEKENIKTIKELKKEAKEIDKNKEKTEEEVNKVKRKAMLSDFFKKNLKDSEKEELKNLTFEYKETKNKLNEALRVKSENLQNTNYIIKKLLENEKKIYKKLFPFVKKEKFNEYKKFIREDLELIYKNSSLESDGIKKETIIKKRIEDIKEKIYEHNEIFSEVLKESIDKKIDENIKELIEKDRFQKLSNNSKIDLLNKLIKNIENKEENIKNKENKTRLLVKKIELYKLIINRIEIFKSKFEE